MQHRTYPPSAKAPAAPRQKRYGWYRKYVGFIGHPKWRLVARDANVHLAFVHVIVDALLEVAAKARARGSVADCEFDVIAIATDIPPDEVAKAYRALCELGWIEQDHIVDWPDRQPEAEDPTNAERQRRYRANKRATTRNKQMGVGETEIAARAAARVTPVQRQAALPAPPVVETTFTGSAEAAAKAWLFGDGGAGYGQACTIIAANYGINRVNADARIRAWLKTMSGDAAALATIISGAREHNLRDERFRGVVEGQIRDAAAGEKLPFGPVAITGGRSQ